MPASTMQPNLEAVTGLTGVRAGAMQRWLEKGWPDNRAEQWRFTRLSGVEKMDLRPATNAAATIGSKAISAMLPDQAVVLSFSNGVLDISGLSDLPPGVSASQLDGNEMELAKLAGSVPQSHPISDLSLAAMSSGVHLDITGKVEAPIILPLPVMTIAYRRTLLCRFGFKMVPLRCWRVASGRCWAVCSIDVN